MAQGKLKVKSKLPQSAKGKQGKKGPAVQRRGNAPIQPKKKKLIEANRLKKMITKQVNETMETELRNKALDGKQSLIHKKEASTSGKKN